MYANEAKAIAIFKNIEDQIRPDIKEQLVNINPTEEDFIKVGKRDFPYGPLSDP